MVVSYKGYDTATAFELFTAGKKAEVAFDDEDPREVWFPATVLKICDYRFKVEYQQPGIGDKAVLHKATVDFTHIRPSPPHLSYTHFGLDDEVDVYYGYGWWSGVITKELADNKYIVFFEHSKKEREFIFSKLRPHLEWKRREWYNEGCNINRFSGIGAMRGAPLTVFLSAFSMCTAGKKAEVAFDKYQVEVWFPATVLKHSHKGKFQVEYQQPGSGDEAVLHKATVDFCCIRPSPPHLSYTDFGLDDKVDAYYDYGWWSGVITKELADNKYNVLIEHTKKEREFICSKVRRHLEWELGEWYNKGDNIFQEVHENNVSTVASKKKRGRPLKLQAKSPETRLTASHEKGGVNPSAASVVESAQMKEVSSPTSSGTKSLEKDHEPLKQDKLHNESQEQDLKAKRSRKKYSSGRGKHDSQDASKEKADENMETRKTEASAGKLLDIVSDDQPLSRWIDGMHSPIPIHSPASERRLDFTCDMNAENLPFVKRTPLWHTIEAMEAFQKIPQNPHFRPLLKGVKESAREGLAIATMVTFSTVVDRIYRLRFEDPRSTIEDCLETLVELESNGFNVEVIRDCLTRLLLLKDKQEELEDRSKGVVEKIEEQKIQEKTIDDEVDEIDRQIRQLEETRTKVLLKKEEWNLEVDAMKATEEAIEQKIIEVAAEFDGLAAAPL